MSAAAGLRPGASTAGPGGASPGGAPSGGDGRGAPVVGDGTTTGQRARRRWTRWRWPLGVLLLVILVGLAAALPEPPRSTTALAPDNPQPTGARALAQVLEREGVEIEYVRRSADALAAAGRGGTLLVTGSALLTFDQVEALAAVPNDLVLLQPDPSMLFAATEAAEVVAQAAEPGLRDASCEDPDAQAAGAVSVGGGGYRALTDAATVCYPADQPDEGALLVVDDGDRRVTALADSSLLTNDRLAEDGNAALTLRLLGRDDRLVWYVPSFDDFGELTGPAAPALSDLVPPWAAVLALQALLVALVAAVWRGRRLGRLVTEPLPVTVRAAETTRGRGRLYRRARAFGHASAALRAGTASRAAARLGLPRSAGAPAVIDALARATGRPSDEVAGLLYGPPPTDDAGLTRLARMLDDLESEVHRP
ncbi:DUF4350 domain-containing protein [Cellulomonas sp. ATA003]|uniref:DUF4350 domain-containing protein n=1 Tax=Cellulomonas sp. ATA003 TaxID=3073064 RepID=UPI002872ED35|nr:DUF4350 domain-containing protein [Cellulomonas sp. ATA003]WNB86367.1 DUF4350 domain-containing protein [Cellulomonas sp. ATA003]